MHKGKDPNKPKKSKRQSKLDEDNSSRSRIILHLENKREKNRQNIRDLEAEIDILAAQIDENDIKTDIAEQQREIENLKKELQQSKEREEKHQTEAHDLRQKIKALEKENTKLKQENRSLKTKANEAKQAAEDATNQKTLMEQVAQEKSEELAKLQGKLERLKGQTASHTQPEPTKRPIILLGDSNYRDIYGHLRIWMNQEVSNIWAPTLGDAKEWVLENQDILTGSTVVPLCGTNDMKKGTARQQVNAQHKEITQLIT